jgi:predicted nucleic acid-binding protein
VRRRVEAIVPELAFAEVANAFLVQVRAGRFTLADTVAASRAAAALPLRVVGLRELAPEAMLLAGHHDLSAYDGCYLALAEATGATLVTADRRLADAAPAAALLPDARPPI